MDFDLDAYFTRIGYDGPKVASLEVLRVLHRLHPAAIPFENLDPLLGRPTPLDLASVTAKLVQARRGGYCFEQNALFQSALEAMGFVATPLIARVVYMSAPGAPPGPRSHRLMRVDLPEGPLIADVGFGGHLFAAPLRLTPGLEQASPMSVLRLDAEGPYLTLMARFADAWAGLYRFTLEPAELADFEVANWHTSTHPNSLFTNNLLAERLTADTRFSLFNRRLTRRHAGGGTEVAELASAAELEAALTNDLGLPASSDVERLFARLPQTERP